MFNKNKIPQQQKNEKTILLLRRHWFIFLKSIIIFLFSFFAPILVYILLISVRQESFSFFTKTLAILFLSAYYLSIWLFFFSSFVDYYLDVWIVTNHRILNIEQKALFSRIISELKIEKIQDITSEVQGIIPTFLNYGTVHIQTAGTTGRFVFKQIPDPANTRKKILTLLKQNKHFEDIMKDKDKISIK